MTTSVNSNFPKVEGYGSGPIEKTVDIAVSRRFKKRGMSWYRECANPLMKLRLLKLKKGNGRFIGMSVEKRSLNMQPNIYPGKKDAYLALVLYDST